MNWEAIGAVGDAAGAIGVIITLGYLAIQIRQNTASQKSHTIQVMFESYVGHLQLCASDPEVGRVFLSGIRDQSGLTDEELVRFHFLMMSLLRRQENIYLQGSHGRILDEDWAALTKSFLDTLARPGAREFWSVHSGRFNAKFAGWVSSELARRDG